MISLLIEAMICVTAVASLAAIAAWIASRTGKATFGARLRTVARWTAISLLVVAVTAFAVEPDWALNMLISE